MVDDSTKDKVVGEAKEVAGKVTGDKETEAEGRVQKVAGKIKDKVEDAAATVKATADRLTGDES